MTRVVGRLGPRGRESGGEEHAAGRRGLVDQASDHLPADVRSWLRGRAHPWSDPRQPPTGWEGAAGPGAADGSPGNVSPGDPSPGELLAVVGPEFRSW